MANILQNLINRIFPGKQNKPGLFQSLMLGGGPLIYPNIDSMNAILKGYEGNAAVYMVVSKDAKKFASIPRYLYSITGKDKKKIESGDLVNLLNRPNPYQGQDAFFEAIRGFYKITGEAFIWLNRGNVTQKLDQSTGLLVDRTDKEIDAMPVLEMYVMPSNHVYLIPDPNNVYGVIGYEFEINGRRLPIRKNDVIHWRSLNMSFDGLDRRHLRGMGMLTPGNRILQQNNDAVDSATRMFQNDGARGILFNETLDDLTPIQRSNIEDVINRKINNNDLKGAIATIQGKWGYENLGGTAVDMELLKATEMSFKMICGLAEVPFEFYLDTTYENKEKAMKGWVLHSILPSCRQLDDELNRVLLKAFGLEKTARICSDGSELPELQQDMQKLVDSLSKSWWLTGNEKREAMGYERYNDAKMDEPMIPTGMVALSESSVDDGYDEMQAELEAQNINS